MELEPLIEAIVQALEDRKGIDIRVLHVGDRTTITDAFVFATANSAPHLKAMHQELAVRLKRMGNAPYRISGEPDSGWIVVDFVDVVVQLLTADQRAYYDLESYWSGPPPRDDD